MTGRGSQSPICFLAMLSLTGILAGCGGHAIPFTSESFLGDAVVTGTGGSRTDGSDLGAIYPVTTIVVATSGNPYSSTSDLPFTGPAVAIGQPVADGQTPFYFSFTYPPNNYKLAESHLVIDTARDSSDTEGIFVDGVFSGRPPTSMVNTSSPQVTYPIYEGNTAGYASNTFYIDWSLVHYKQATTNTFDLAVSKLLTTTPDIGVYEADLLKDGFLPVVTGDDSPVYQAFLVMNGYTISKTPLTCTNSPTFTFQNVYLHNDGNSIGQSAFTGTVVSPYDSTQTAQSAFRSVEWYYDAQLPRVDIADVTLSTGSLALTVTRNTAVSPYAAIVINGIGIDEPGFDRGTASAAVESWVSGASQTYWQSFVSSIPDTNTAQSVTLDLVQLLGATQLRTLLGQGKLNIALAGSLATVAGSAATSTRTYGAPVSGPELSLAGSYFTQLCDVPNNPDSPLADSQPLPPDAGDTTSPLTSSISATQITSTSAVIQWLTDEGATSQVTYGVADPTLNSTTEDTTLVTFHSVQLTGLQPYKVYTFQVHTADANGNLTVSGRYNFQTLR